MGHTIGVSNKLKINGGLVFGLSIDVMYLNAVGLWLSSMPLKKMNNRLHKSQPFN